MNKQPERNICIVCNPLSGKGQPLRLLKTFETFLGKEQIAFKTFTGQLPDNLNTFTDLVVMGGDGTINYVLNHFKEIAVPISIIPCGTGNDFAFEILGRSDHETYFSKAIHGIPQNVDAGICNGRYFINGVGIGFDGWVVRRLLAKKWFNGKAAYYSTVISLLLFYRETEVSVQVEDECFNMNLFMFNAANCRTYGGGFKVAPMASFRDGLLEAISISRISLLQRLRYLPVIEKGKHLDRPLHFIRYTQARKMKVISGQTLHAHLDGEYMAAKEFDIQMLPDKYQFRSG